MNRTKKILSGTDVETAVIMNGVNLDLSFFYVTGFSSGLFEGCAVVFDKDEMEVLVSRLEEESAKEGRHPLFVFSRLEEEKQRLKEKLKEKKRIGINATELSHKNFLTLKECAPEAEFKDISEAIRDARGIKDGEELKRLGRAADIASKAADAIPELVHEGIKESELAAELNYIMQKKGSSSASFTPIVAFGKNAAIPHYVGGDIRLKKGDFVLCDFGAQYKRYISDITRTYIFKKSTEKQERMYNHVLQAQRLALKEIKAGVAAKLPHIKTEEYINTNYKGGFIHGLGHSIGLGVHDGLRMYKDADYALQEGMVFTVEPGIYIPGFGGVRIEDDIVITKDGYKMLTKSRKSLQIIK